jgi:hypothetical protein
VARLLGADHFHPPDRHFGPTFLACYGQDFVTVLPTPFSGPELIVSMTIGQHWAEFSPFD